LFDCLIQTDSDRDLGPGGAHFLMRGDLRRTKSAGGRLQLQSVCATAVADQDQIGHSAADAQSFENGTLDPGSAPAIRAMKPIRVRRCAYLKVLDDGAMVLLLGSTTTPRSRLRAGTRLGMKHVLFMPSNTKGRPARRPSFVEIN
jgi:hypothetical protein